MKKLLSSKIVLFILQLIYVTQAIIGLGFGILYLGFNNIDSLIQIKLFIIQMSIVPIISLFCFNVLVRFFIKIVIDLDIKTFLRFYVHSMFFWPFEHLFELGIIGLLFIKLFPILGTFSTMFVVFTCMDLTDKIATDITKRLQKSTP